MGQKVHPTGIRLGIVKRHTSIWYADKGQYADRLNADLRVRKMIQEQLAHASVSRIEIERPSASARITIHTARPGIVIGKRGEDVDRLRARIASEIGVPVHINIEEVRKPDLDATLVAQSVAQQLQRRVMFRRAMRRAVQNAMRQGAQGVKIQVSGRLPCTRCARMSITALPKRRPPTGSLASRFGSSRARFLAAKAPNLPRSDGIVG